MKSTNLPSAYMQRHTGKKWRRVIALAAACLLIAGGWWVLARPTEAPPSQTPVSALAWPPYGEAAVGIVVTSTIETHGSQTPVPTASTAKLITALVVLEAKPLALGEAGPIRRELLL